MASCWILWSPKTTIKHSTSSGLSSQEKLKFNVYLRTPVRVPMTSSLQFMKPDLLLGSTRTIPVGTWPSFIYSSWKKDLLVIIWSPRVPINNILEINQDNHMYIAWSFLQWMVWSSVKGFGNLENLVY